MASSAFSFHCMICFEEFDTHTNYPVVLPCGHTYVCIKCANRLDKCMECREPLTIKCETVPPPPPPGGVPGMPGTPGMPITPLPNGASAAALSAAAAAGGVHAGPDAQKENMNYADRVRNSPGFRRRYGHRNEFNNNNKRGGPSYHDAPPPTPPKPVPKQRLPLPKNAVLLSLIQASEPARRRAEVEAPPTPQKTVNNGDVLEMAPETPSPGSRQNVANAGSFSGTFPKFSRPHPLFLNGSSSGDLGNNDTSTSNLVGSQPDDEEHKIRVGTYLEGGPCGTYAVAAKSGLLVYPTLFEHTLPSALNGLTKEEDEVKRDVEELVKKHRASAGMRTFPGNSTNDNENISKDNNSSTSSLEEKSNFDANGSPIMAEIKRIDNDNNNEPLQLGGGAGLDYRMQLGGGGGASPVDTEIGVSHTWVECNDDENIEAQCASVRIDSRSTGLLGGEGIISPLHSPAGVDIPMDDVDGEKDLDGTSEPCAPNACGIAALGGRDGLVDMPSLEDIRAMAAAASDESEDYDVHELSVSLTISEDGESDDDSQGKNNVIDMSTRTLPARRSQSTAGIPITSSSHVAKDDFCSSSAVGVGPVTKKFVRHFSQGSYPKLTQKKDTNRDPSQKQKNTIVDEFDRPLIRLKYGDRVQVVSMDSRGWVKLARGYGYIRLENDKQLVKVGGTSDKACQIEAMLHELSIERNRLKQEQMELERLSAGLMIDLQSSLITSDDHVVVPAPEGSLRRTDSELSISLMGTGGRLDTSNPKISLDDIDVSNRSKTILRNPRPTNKHSQNITPQPDTTHREIRTAKSHSPGRASSLGQTTAKAPPSPPHGQVTGNMHTSQHNGSSKSTPTRVNFRTGLSGHRALTNSHAHPHDFLENRGFRSMSNHSGISSSKKPTSSRGRSIY